MYNSDLLKPYLEAKYSNNIPFKNSELYSLCGCTTDNQKASIRSLKSRYLKEFEAKKSSETSETKIFQKSKIYTNPEVKDRFHEVLELINKYPELPLFMYSKLYGRVDKEYVLTGTLTPNEMEALGIDSKEEFKKLTYSFYDMYIELFKEINKGNYNQEIEAYMEDVLQSYGETYCNENFGLSFSKDKIEERTYWSEKEAKEYVDKMINIEHPKDVIEYNWSEDKLRKANGWAIEHAESMVKEGSYIDDYSNVIKDVSEVIANTIERISRNVLESNETFNLDIVRVKLLIYLMFDYRQYNIFDDRPNEYIRVDLLKLYTEMKRKRIDLGNIPCNEYNEGINNVYDIYREYDYRWFGMNESEKFLQYKTDPTEEQETIPESVHDNSEIIDKLETEFERLKGSS